MSGRFSWYGRQLARAIMLGKFRHYAAKALGQVGVLTPRLRYAWGLVAKPAYGYGLLAAAVEAGELGYEGVTAVELGVGSGNGLVVLERHAEALSTIVGVAISVVGFDSGAGLPRPVDHRDVPYRWAEGDYPMDEAKLRRRLSGAELQLGDVSDTVERFVVERADRLRTAPVGFVSFDLDYWSSTLAAFVLFRGDSSVCLPRVTCYFDDIPWTVEDIGVLRAIRDFNGEPHGRRIRRWEGLRSMVAFEPSWADLVFQAHLFDHPRYNHPLGGGVTTRLTS